MSFNTNISKLGKMYMANNTFNFNDALSQYYMRKSIGLDLMYSMTSYSIIENNVTSLYTCSITGGCIFNNLNINDMYISNNLIAKNNITINTDFYIQNNAIINNISVFNTLFINNSSIINNNVTVNNNLFSNYAMINSISVNNILVDSDSIFNNITCRSNLNISLDLSCKNIQTNNINVLNDSILYNNVTILSNLNTNNFITNSITTNSILTCKNLLTYTNSTINSSLYVSNITNIMGNINVSSVCNIVNDLYIGDSIKTNKISFKGSIICALSEYLDNATAAANGVPYNGLYRLGGLVKIRLDLVSPIILLNGDPIINTYVNNVFTDPLISSSDNLGDVLTPVIVGTVNITIVGTYNLSYYVLDSYNNKSNIVYRTVNVINYPIISSILIASKIITFTLTGIYNTLSYMITKSNIVIVSEIELLTNSIDTTSLTLDLIPYNIILLLKDFNNSIIKTIVIGLTSIKLGPVLEIVGFNPYIVKSSPATYDVSINIKAYTIPSTPLSITYSVVDNLNISQTFITGTLLGIVYNKSYKVTYSAKDSSNITVSYTLDVSILDTTSPVITLIGDAINYIDKNSIYVDPGYNVSDNSGSYTITVKGYVNTLNIGPYFIKYNAIDRFNNKREVIRSVTVRDPIIKLNPPIIATVDQYNIWINPGYILQSSFNITVVLVTNRDDDVNINFTNTYYHTLRATDVYSSTTVTRTVIVRKSVINLLFPVSYGLRLDRLNTMYTQLNSPFIDIGYFITDSSVILSIVNTINTSISGVYKIVYTTVDSNSFNSIATRYVIVSNRCFIPYSDATLNGRDISPYYTPYYNYVGRGISQTYNTGTGPDYWFGVLGKTIGLNFDTSFDYNGTWSIMMKISMSPCKFVRFDFDNLFSLTTGNPVDGTLLNSSISIYGNTYGSYIGGPNVTTVYYTTFSIIASNITTGVYIVLNRISNYNIFKIYSLVGILLCDVTSKVPFAYIRKQSIFSITNVDPTSAFTSSSATISLGSGFCYKKTELFPYDWTDIFYISPTSNSDLYYALL